MNKRLVALSALSAVTLVCSPVRAEVSDVEFKTMMEKYLQSDGGRETVGKSVETYFRSLQEKAVKEQEARAAAEIEDQFKNPVKIDAGTSPSKGPASAKITIIEFSDFQCPYCKRGKDTMEEVLKMYPNDVKLVFKNLPLPFHKEAGPSARAALAAHKQGKFWEMHDALFDNQAQLSAQMYLDTAKKLGLNVDKFKADMESEEIKKAVEADAELAGKHGIQGTPGFFVNGVAVKGAYPADHFKTIIERWKKESAKS